ncbi:LysR family transcriptional regulator [Acetobacteraceae bacterium H6797]|nr:LysR family transcriptional regulator [Acetobacteraceae bacterium H6797]
MELRHLRAFVAVAEHLHFAKAAETLGITPPSLTEQIQVLERLLDVRLFRRTKRSVALTDAGKLFLDEARLALAQVERAERIGRQAGRGERGIVEIGFAPSAGYAGVLAASVERYRQEHPEVVLQLHEMESVPQLEALATGRLDIGFVRPPLLAPPGVVIATLFQEPIVIALSASHPLAAKERIAPADLAGEAFIIPNQGVSESFHHHTTALGEKGGFVPRLAHRGRDLIAVACLVELGMGVAAVPASLQASLTLQRLVYRPLAGPPQMADIAAAFRRNEAAPATQAFITQLRREAARQARS